MRRMAATIGILALAACGPADTETETDVQSAAEQPMPDEEMTAEVSVLQVESLEAGGEYLTDSRGHALYAIEGKDDPAACVDECAAAWPPYVQDATAAEGLAPSGSALQPDLLGSVERPDGATQVTYGGHPLYLYTKDAGPGETTGQDVTDEWGEWYLVQPSGELQEGEASGS